MPYTQKQLNVKLPSLPRRGKRTAEVYEAMYKHCYKNIQRLVQEYSEAEITELLEIALKDIQHYVRRYHEYCLKQKDGGYYIQETNDNTTWEHVIPISICVNYVLNGVITIDDFMQMPVMYLSKKDDAKLRKAKLVKTTPDVYYPFKRYVQAGIDITKITTRDGKPITENFTFNDHVETVKRLTTR